jgi:hypothetical protein
MVGKDCFKLPYKYYVYILTQEEYNEIDFRFMSQCISSCVLTCVFPIYLFIQYKDFGKLYLEGEQNNIVLYDEVKSLFKGEHFTLMHRKRGIWGIVWGLMLMSELLIGFRLRIDIFIF